MSYSTNPVTGNNAMYIDERLTTQNQDLSYNISYGKNNTGFQTPSTNYLPYVLNADGSVSYTEQNKTFAISCSESIPDLYLVIQPYNFTNNINQGFAGYDATGYLTPDALHTMTDQNLITYSGVWFQWDFGVPGAVVFNKVIVNVPDYTQGINTLVLLGSNDLISWNLLTGQYYDYNLNQTQTHTYSMSAGSSSYRYCRVLITKVSNNSNFCISGIQFINDYILSGTLFGTGAQSGVAVGSSSQTLNLRYTTVQKNVGTIGSLILDADLDNTYPPTNTNGLIPPSVNVATQLYNQINGIISTPLFFLRYMLTSALTTTAVTNYKIFQIGTSQQSYINGLTLSTIVNSTNGRLTIPYNGIYNITETVNTSASTSIHLDLFSVSGTYGAGNVITQITTVSTDVYAHISYTGYFAAGDVVIIEFYTSTAVAVQINSGLSTATISLLQRT